MALSSGDLTKKTAAYTRRDPYLDRMEQLLNVYVTYSREQNIPVSGAMLQTKALELYTKIRKTEEKKKETEGATSASDKEKDLPWFTASRGWLQRYAHRQGMGSYNLHGEAASADHIAADRYKGKLQKF